VRDAFVQGQHSANPKNVDGDQQRIKVKNLSVPVWVEFVRRPSAPFDTDEQQDFISQVRSGMEGFGQHRGTAGCEGRNVFADRDCQICSNRNHYDPLRRRESHPSRTRFILGGMYRID
jgi:hypothetical protein